MRLFGIGGLGITSGIILIPLIIGVIASLSMSLRTMSAFELICMLVLAFGGLGLFLRSLRDGAAAEAAAQRRLRS
jgi:hypothetical protein